MRDGIPRALPVPRKWRAYLECADRPADRGTDRVITCFREAIHDTMRRELPGVARRHLQVLIDQNEPLLPGLGFTEASESEIMLERGQSHRLAEALTEARAAMAAGATPKVAIHTAMTRQMESLTTAMLRQIEQNLAGKLRPNELKRFLSERDRSLAAINFRLETGLFLAELPVAPSLNPQQNLVDDDLRGAS